MVSADLLFKYGFLNSKGKELVSQLEQAGKKLEDYMKENSGKLSKYVDEEVAEVKRGIIGPTGFPNPSYREHLVFQSYNLSIEEGYFWILRSLEESFGFTKVNKIIDLFAASENSSFFGMANQRLGIQQEKASQFLATIGRMIKDMFRIVREIRVIDERIDLYEQSLKGNQSSDVVLKGIWIDFVEGGSKNPASVYGMAKEVGFVTLPDLFFDTFAKNVDEVDDEIKKLEGKFNMAVIRVLQRKLKSYYTWKKLTYHELKTKRTFTVKYLYQHYKSIQMYMNWVKPYLRNIERLTMDGGMVSTPYIISAFENSMIEIEFLAQKPGNGDFVPCVLATFGYRTQPSLSYQQEGYNRGPIHVGRMELTLRGYVWKQKQIDEYIKMRQAEDFQILSSIDESIKAAMDALGGDIEKYLEEVENSFKKTDLGSKNFKKSGPPRGPPGRSALEPFIGVALGFKELFGALIPINIGKTFSGMFSNNANIMKAKQEAEKKKGSLGAVKAAVSVTYESYKKAHGMLAW